jgi:hypothetical protein
VIAGEKKGLQKRDIGWGPQPKSSLISTEAFAASSCWAHSTRPLSAAKCSGVPPQHRRSGARGSVTGGDRWAPRGWSRRGRPRRRPSPRGTPRPPGGRWVLRSAALTRRRWVGPGCRGRSAGGPGPPGGCRRAPRGRCGRLGARRNKNRNDDVFSPFFPLIFMISQSPSLLSLLLLKFDWIS